MGANPTLADLAANPALAAAVDLPRRSSGRWSASGRSCERGSPLRFNRPAPRPRTLLAVSDAASRLCVSKHWLRRHWDPMPFTVRLSAGQFYSAQRESTAISAGRMDGRRT
jgi:hypothetical protein